jgi:hypothetical protein
MSQPINSPKRVEKGYAITAEWAKSIDSSITRLARQVSSFQNKSTGIYEQMPFLLTASQNGNEIKYRVSSFRSTVTDQTNGPAIDLSEAGFDEDQDISEPSYIYLSATVDSNLDLDEWEINASESVKPEVDGSGDPFQQTGINLLIGKIGIEDAKLSYIRQSCFSSQIIVYDFVNGAIVKAFMPHVVHDSFTPS